MLRIGELSRRVGVSEQLLRAWESRYGLLKPERSAGGYRLYSAQDQSRIRRMQVHLAAGLATAQAAQAVIDEEARGVAGKGVDATDDRDGADRANGAASADIAARVTAEVTARAELFDATAALSRALDDLDEPSAQTVLDRLLTSFTPESVLREVVVPYLHELGERWECGEVSVAQEHFASHVLRGRLTGLARGWGRGLGPMALLACPPDEQHDLALLVFGIVLNRGGWRVEYLGANTPMQETIRVAAQTRPDLVVIASTTRKRLASARSGLMELADLAPLALAGAGATTSFAFQVGARLLTADPVTEAETLSGS